MCVFFHTENASGIFQRICKESGQKESGPVSRIENDIVIGTTSSILISIRFMILQEGNQSCSYGTLEPSQIVRSLRELSQKF